MGTCDWQTLKQGTVYWVAIKTQSFDKCLTLATTVRSIHATSEKNFEMAKTIKKQASIDEQKWPDEGAVYAFKLKDGRFGACRVLRKISEKDGGWCLRVAVTPWVGKSLPNLKEPALREILHLTHHAWKGWKEVYLVADPPGPGFEYVGRLPPTMKERRQKETGLAGEWPRDDFAQQVLMQWEWDHTDRGQLLANEQKQRAREDEKDDRAQARRIARLRKMSLADFRRGRFLRGWTHIESKQAVVETRQSIQDAIDRMIALGRKPQRKSLLAEVKRLIQQWNRLQKEHDGFMATTERDDLCVHLTDLFVVAGLLDDDPIEFFERWEDL